MPGHLTRSVHFKPYKGPNTLKTYFTLARRVLVYFDRVAASEDHLLSVEYKEESFRPEDRVHPAQEQLDTWHAACMLAKREIPADDKGKQNGLKKSLLESWILLTRQNTGSRRYRWPSVLLRHADYQALGKGLYGAWKLQLKSVRYHLGRAAALHL